MDDRTHQVLLALAGRIDDDLLAWCRELVAVGEDGRALELITATLVADGTALPPQDRAAVVDAARTARTDLDADAALPSGHAAEETPHRFDAGHGVEVLAAAVGALPERLVAGCRTWVTFRSTPAGSAPGPLPQPVVLVEVAADDPRPLDVLAYQLATACARVGAPTAAVEVVVAGAARPAYQQAAVAHALPVHGADTAPHTDPYGTAVQPPWDAPGDTDTFAVQTPAAPSAVSEADEIDAGPAEGPAPSWPELGSLVMPPGPRRGTDADLPGDDPSASDGWADRNPFGSTVDSGPLDWTPGADLFPSTPEAPASSFATSGTTDGTPADGTPSDRTATDSPTIDGSRTDTSWTGEPRTDETPIDEYPIDGYAIEQTPTGVPSADETPAMTSPEVSTPPAPIPSTADLPSAAPTVTASTGTAPTEAAPTEAAPTEAAPTEAAPSATPPAEATSADDIEAPRAPVTPLRARTEPPRPRPTAVPPLPRPTPTPLGRRRPLTPVGDPPVRSLPSPPAASDGPALASIGDPFGGPIEERASSGSSRRDPTIDEADPLGLGRLPVEPLPDEDDFPIELPDAAAADSWLADWISGDWAMSRSGSADPLGLDPVSETPRPEPADDPRAPSTDRVEERAESTPPVSAAPPLPERRVPGRPFPGRAAPFADRSGPQAEVAPPPRRPTPRPAPAPAPPVEQTSFVLPPESVARLSDADRELLARLQSELGDAPRPRVSRRAGIGGNGASAPNGHGPSDPPDLAG